MAKKALQITRSLMDFLNLLVVFFGNDELFDRFGMWIYIYHNYNGVEKKKIHITIQKSIKMIAVHIIIAPCLETEI